ncbi:hypothetical protein PENTCL1PPCAC_16594, partial [Pristionchus entomophagus]
VLTTAFHIARMYGLVSDWDQAEYLKIMMVSIQFAASPLITLFFIRPYRRAVKTMFVCLASNQHGNDRRKISTRFTESAEDSNQLVLNQASRRNTLHVR